MAGLSLAIALRRRGLAADVIERDERGATAGAGLYLVGAATRALAQLGVAGAVIDAGFVSRSQSMRNDRGERLADIDTDAFWSQCGPCLGVSRVAVHSVLAQQLERTPIRHGVTIDAMQPEPDRVGVGLSDGSRETYDLVVGADGIRSSVRQLAFGVSPPTFRRQVGWRFLAHRPDGIDGWSVFLGSGCAFLIVPVADDRAYCYADRSTPRPLDDPPASRIGRLRERFASFAAPVIEVLDGLDPAEPIHFAPIEEVLHSPSARGRVVLIGDAAHAMSPNMACGAAMAFEDALVLADVIAARGTSPEAIAEFVGRRRPRLDWIRKQTNRRDRLRGLPRLIREPLLRRMAGRTYRANYLPLLDPP